MNWTLLYRNQSHILSQLLEVLLLACLIWSTVQQASAAKKVANFQHCPCRMISRIRSIMYMVTSQQGLTYLYIPTCVYVYIYIHIIYIYIFCIYMIFFNNIIYMILYYIYIIYIILFILYYILYICYIICIYIYIFIYYIHMYKMIQNGSFWLSLYT